MAMPAAKAMIKLSSENMEACMFVFYNFPLYSTTNKHERQSMKDIFRRFSNKVSEITGTATAFLAALLIVAVWGLTGPIFGFSNTWQLVINTGTTIVTFLMVFLIQNTQNRNSTAMQLKLDELIRSTSKARDSFVDLEDLSDDELGVLNEEFKRMHDSWAPGQHPSIHQLHHKIEAVHKRRQSLNTSRED